MGVLTERVLSLALRDGSDCDAASKEIIEFLKSDVPADANIEVLLTHLSDLISLSERSRTLQISVGGHNFSKKQLCTLHSQLLEFIADTIRFGFKPEIIDEVTGETTAKQVVGKIENSIVDITDHRAFVRALFGTSQAGLKNRRSAVEIFTTNYDTLIEDALALERISYWDGFTGGGVAYWSGADALEHSKYRAVLTKLHGSIDWYRSAESSSALYRTRYGDLYPKGDGQVMIYPQASKYVHAQENPFAELFQRFRLRLKGDKEQVLFVCGYSFGDDHINWEIDNAMSDEFSQLTLVAFSFEDDEGLPKVLRHWLTNRSWSERVFVASPLGLYQGNSGPSYPSAEGQRDWWTFEGASKLIQHGIPLDILEIAT